MRARASSAVEALAEERAADRPGHADAARAGAEDDEALVREPAAQEARRGEQARERDRARALDVVVEGGDDVAEAHRGR